MLTIVLPLIGPTGGLELKWLQRITLPETLRLDRYHLDIQHLEAAIAYSLSRCPWKADAIIAADEAGRSRIDISSIPTLQPLNDQTRKGQGTYIIGFLMVSQSEGDSMSQGLESDPNRSSISQFWIFIGKTEDTYAGRRGGHASKGVNRKVRLLRSESWYNFTFSWGTILIEN